MGKVAGGDNDGSAVAVHGEDDLIDLLRLGEEEVNG